jgi:hypothetical protein
MTVVDLGRHSGEHTDRPELSDLRALLALSMIMTEAVDTDAVFQLAIEAVPSLTGCHVEGLILAEGECPQTAGAGMGPAMRAHLLDQVAGLSTLGGPVEVPTHNWAWAYPMRSLRGNAGFVIVGAPSEPSPHELFLLRALAQQTGLALTNSRMHANERDSAEMFAELNSELEATVSALRQGMLIHQRLTDAAAAGVDGITRTIHGLTGLPIVVEYRDGTRCASSGDPPAGFENRMSASQREKLLEQALDESRAVRHGDCWVALARARDDILGVLTMVDVDVDVVTREQDRMALEYGATVLAIELAHVQNVAETELRLRRDIVEDLLAGTDPESVLVRARGLRYDLDRPHRVVLVDAKPHSRGRESLFRAVRRAAEDLGVGSLLVNRAGAVVLLAHTDVRWDKLRSSIERGEGIEACRVVAGGRCSSPAGFPQSYREAQLARSMMRPNTRTLCFDDLGVFRIFSQVTDPVHLEQLANDWLGALIDYDREHDADLVQTVSAYMECGGNQEQTSEALIIHRSTLKYRLKRIREISGHDLSDPDTHLHVHLATRAWQVLQALG